VDNPQGKHRGAIIVISGPSGVGKSTVCRLLCQRLPAQFSVSYTTRPQRTGEADGQDYRYISEAEFDRLLASGGMLEWAAVYGHRYGTPIEPVAAALEEGRAIILEIDINGAVQVRRRFPEALTFFLLPPSQEEQRRRITGRQTDPQAEIARRLAHADGEIRFAHESGCYRRFIVNEDLDRTIEEIIAEVKKETTGC
jgi:guanylate kinase